jgi:hypothetical protein
MIRGDSRGRDRYALTVRQRRKAAGLARKLAKVWADEKRAELTIAVCRIKRDAIERAYRKLTGI